MMNIKYRPNGRDVKTGLDCYGLVSYMYKKDFDKTIVDFDYKDPDDPKNEKYFIESMNDPKWIKCKPQKGAVVGLRVNGHISHCGYMINDKEFIHIMNTTGVVRAKINSVKWKNRVVGVYKYD